MKKIYLCRSKDEGMIKTISIENYKSILKLGLDLGRMNIFIGANGSGKSNILEAVAMVSAQEEIGKINIESLIGKGVRVVKPALTISSFLGKISPKIIKIGIGALKEKDILLEIAYNLSCSEENNIFSEWQDQKIAKDMLNSNAYGEFKLLELMLKSHPADKNKEQVQKLEQEYQRFIIWKERRAYFQKLLSEYLIFNPDISALRGLSNESKKTPLGINGEGLDVLIASFSDDQKKELLSDCYIDWLDNILIDNKEEYKRLGYKLGRSISNLFFVDKYMQKKNNVFSAENANEGALFILFYLALFISDKTPSFFAIDNIESGLNPRLCRYLMKALAELSRKNNKQALITTHNPAILDGLNLHDDEQRLFVVSRNDEGQTKVERVKLKPEGQENIKLSDLWISGQLGGIPEMF